MDPLEIEIDPKDWPEPNDDKTTTIPPKMTVAIFQLLGYVVTQYARCAKKAQE